MEEVGDESEAVGDDEECLQRPGVRIDGGTLPSSREIVPTAIGVKERGRNRRWRKWRWKFREEYGEELQKRKVDGKSFARNHFHSENCWYVCDVITFLS